MKTLHNQFIALSQDIAQPTLPESVERLTGSILNQKIDFDPLTSNFVGHNAFKINAVSNHPLAVAHDMLQVIGLHDDKTQTRTKAIAQEVSEIIVASGLQIPESSGQLQKTEPATFCMFGIFALNNAGKQEATNAALSLLIVSSIDSLAQDNVQPPKLQPPEPVRISRTLIITDEMEPKI